MQTDSEHVKQRLEIVLVEPQIPPNTGNIGRTCVVTGSRLHLVGPLGFNIDDRSLKRAGLDYWPDLDVCRYDSLEELWSRYPGGRFFYATTKANRSYADVRYQPGDFLVFGKETSGLPEPLLEAHQDECITIPMAPHQRSLNLANAVAVITYEAYRQLGYPFWPQ